MKKIFIFSIINLLCLFAIFTIPACNQPSSETTNNNKAETVDMTIPGPRTCFWTRGPVSKDPYINIAYPDAAVFYWSAVFTIPEGAKLHLEGEFPHSRYMSLISYDGRGAPIESLADYLIKPNEGATNPFVEGADRTSEKRSYKIEIVNLPPLQSQKEGVKLENEAYTENGQGGKNKTNTLNAVAYADGQQSILYRIYVPDKNTAPTGGVNMPTPVVTLASGKILRGDEACKALKTKQGLKLTPNAVGVPMKKYREITNQPNKPDTWPATNPPTWFLQYDRKFLLGIYTGEFPESPRKSTGGFYPNLDNNYVRTIINRKHGKIFVLKGKLPKTPKTYNGDEKMTKGELVYWSICSNQGFANTRVNDCLFDEQVPVNKNGEYVIVISRAEDRPRNARLECGIGWLPMADDGDGAFDEDVTVVQIRNMLASDDFKQAIQKVTEIGTEKEIMGDYLPTCFYTTPGAFEVFFPCLEQ
mgnify:CR=1 FL=1